MTAVAAVSPPRRWFWLFFAGQTTSNLGSAFTTFALPLLVYRTTGSATALGGAEAMAYLPWLVGGLAGGAIVDRVDRRRAMILADLGRAAAVSAIPILSTAGALGLGWIYTVVVAQATLQILFASGEFAAVPALVDREGLVAANSRLSASYAAASVAGAALGGLVVAVLPVADGLWVDAGSFVVSALTLAAIPVSFNQAPPPGLRSGSLGRTIRALAADTRAGLVYVWANPVLRVVSVMLTLVNLFGSAATGQVALVATQRLGATNSQVGYLYAASSVGVVACSLVVGPLSRRLPLAAMTLGALVIYGSGTAAFGLTTSYRVGVAAWVCVGAATVLFNVSTTTLRQQIVPNHLLGRVWNIALVFAWCTIPIGAFAGGLVVSATHRPDLVYAGVGAVIVAIALGFTRSGLAGGQVPTA